MVLLRSLSVTLVPPPEPRGRCLSCPARPTFHAVVMWVALFIQHDHELAGGGHWGRPSVLGMCLWNAPEHILLSAPTHAMAPGPSQSEAPGQQSLQAPGKLVGDDLHPLDLHSAIQSDEFTQFFALSSVSSGKHSKGAQTQTLWQFPYLILPANHQANTYD